MLLERAFYAKADRDEYINLAKSSGARVILVFLKVTDKEQLWERVCKRSAGPKTANSAFDISRELFEMYWNGFENPEGEGEIVVEVT